MEIDKRQIMKKIEKMSDEDLKSIVSEIAKGAGVSERRVEQTVSDISKLRRGIGNMSDRDLQKALSMLDGESAEKIKRQMNM
ncbi:MAG: hypothetical protein E7615_05195 [Ruminococcaceae bacterium]|nr:hypothetical protein [Oscillospiraceae bacterium]